MSSDTWDAITIVAAFVAVCSLLVARGFYRWLTPRIPVWKRNLKRFQQWCYRLPKYRVKNLAIIEANLAEKQAEIDRLTKELERLACNLQYWMSNPVVMDANQQLVLTFGDHKNGNGNRRNGNGHNGKRVNGNGHTVTGHKVQDGYVLYEWNTAKFGHEVFGIPFDEYHKQEIEKLVKVQRNGVVEWVPADKATELEILNAGKLLRWKKFK